MLMSAWISSLRQNVRTLSEYLEHLLERSTLIVACGKSVQISAEKSVFAISFYLHNIYVSRRIRLVHVIQRNSALVK